MNRIARWGFALALLPVAACSSTPPAPAPVAEAPPAVAPVDQAFVTMAAQGGMAEVQLATLAQTNARSPRVKTFASEMIKDHGAANDQLMKIAQAKGITPPTDLNDMQNQQKTMLTAEKGAKFDRDYMHGQIADHQAMIQAFQDESTNGQDPEIKAFAASTLPAIQQHLAEAQKASGMKMARPMMHKKMATPDSNT
ncbi:MAG: DUF4142 domain-containing protein [Janthinobacterium lividum]